ncbi:MAG: PIN domain-containing protein [bacterium]
MGVIIDTCVWVDIERGRLRPVEVADRIQNDAVFLTPTILAELQYGVERASNATHRHLRFSAMERLRRKPCLIIDSGTGLVFGRIAATLDNQGKPSTHRLHDLWIAAVAIQHGHPVLTRNATDFADIPGLRVVAI